MLYGCLSKQVKLAVITVTIVCMAKPLHVYDKIIIHGIHSNGTREVYAFECINKISHVCRDSHKHVNLLPGCTVNTLHFKCWILSTRSHKLKMLQLLQPCIINCHVWTIMIMLDVVMVCVWDMQNHTMAHSISLYNYAMTLVIMHDNVKL